MAVGSKHPDYEDRASEWEFMRHCARGEKAIKDQAEKYLPMPEAFRSDRDAGAKLYGAYQARTKFPEIVTPTLRGLVGVIHRVPAVVELPAQMDPIRERCTFDGLTLETFHERVTAEILLQGRYSVLVDAPIDSVPGQTPFLAGYSAESLINWSPKRDVYVLDESGPRLDGLTWSNKNQFRVLTLRGGQYVQFVVDSAAAEDAILESDTYLQPTRTGARPMSEIPFVVIGAKDLSVNPEEQPLMGVARAALAMYQLYADYRHQLYMTGLETLVVINGKVPEGVGPSVVIALKSEPDMPSDVKYVGPQGVGIDRHRVAIQDEREEAIAAGARLFDAQKKGVESGDALRLKFAADTATLSTVARSSAAGLERALRYVASMMGLTPEQVTVKPNMDFVDSTMTPAEAKDLVTVWQSGAISHLTLYENLQRGGIASEERTLEQEQAMLEEEVPEETTPAPGEGEGDEDPPIGDQ